MHFVSEKLSDEIKYLGRRDVIECGGWDFKAAAHDVENAFGLDQAGGTVMPPELPLRWPNPLAAGWESGKRAAGKEAGSSVSDFGIFALPAYVGGDQPVAGLKWTAHRPAGIRPDLPHVMGLIILNDGASACPAAVLESGLIGAARTAAVTAVAMKRLGWKSPSKAGVFGAGFLAEAHLRMLSQLFPDMDEVYLVNRTRERAERLRDRLKDIFPWKVTLLDFGPRAFEMSDVVITCTSSEKPFVEKSWVHRGLLAVHIGLFEFSYEAMRAFDRIVVDKWGEFKNTSLKSLFRMYRDGLVDEKDIHAELGELLAAPPEDMSGHSVFFNSFGLSIFDITLARRIVQTAREKGLGCDLAL